MDLEREPLELGGGDAGEGEDVGRCGQVGAALARRSRSRYSCEGTDVSAGHVARVKVEELTEGTAPPVGIADRLIPQLTIERAAVEAATAREVSFERCRRIRIRL